MNILRLKELEFPVKRGTLEKINGYGDYCWCVEIYCGRAKQLEGGQLNDEADAYWFAINEPYLYAQLLPLRADSPEDLIARTYHFPQTPEDDPASWDCGQWPFFCLYLMEHDYAFPMTIAFLEQLDGRYHVRIEGGYPADNTVYKFEVDTWLDWQTR